MDKFLRAKSELTTESFSKEKCSRAFALYRASEGRERLMIGQLFESQFALCKSPDQTEWLHRLLQGVESKV